MYKSILDKRLILVLGKGGVGRSTVAASMASLCAKRGRRTLLFQANAKDRFASYFNVDALGTEISRLEPNLYAVNTTPAAAIEEYGLMILRWRRVYNLVFENKIVKHFLRAIPGFDDYSIIGKAWFHTTEEKRGQPIWDTVVFDMPASGHSLAMLKIPKVIIETVPEGPLTRDARSLLSLLRDPLRTAIALVTLAEEMPANEARELNDKLKTELELTPHALIVNQLFPNHAPPGSPTRRVLDALRGVPQLNRDLKAITDHANLSQARRDLQNTYLATLTQDLGLPPLELPLLFSPIERAQIATLAKQLDKQLDSTAVRSASNALPTSA